MRIIEHIIEHILCLIFMIVASLFIGMITCKINPVVPKIISIIFLAFPIHRLLVSKKYEKTIGRINYKWKHEHRRKWRVFYYPIYEYSVNGTKYKTKKFISTGSQYPEHEPGEKNTNVVVKYNPKNPKRAYVEHDFTIIYSVICAIILFFTNFY